MEDSDGGVLLVGGIRDDKSTVLDSILRLSSSKDIWVEVETKLTSPRFGHIAFFVPNLANCRKAK